MLKWAIRLVVLLALLVVVAVAVLWIYLDRVATAGLTRGIEYAGGVPCGVENVSVSLLGGHVGIRSLVIGNPPGYPEGEMFSLQRGEVDLRLASLWNQPVHVRRLELEAPVVRIQAGPGGSNVRVFLRNVQDRLGPDSKAPKPERPQTRMRVDRLLIRNATVRLSAGLLNKQLAEIRLDEVELKDVHGRDGRGVTSGELAALILVELIRRGAPRAGLSLENLLPEALTRSLDALMKTGGGVIDTAGEVIRKPLETILDAIRKPRTRPAIPRSPRRR